MKRIKRETGSREVEVEPRSVLSIAHAFGLRNARERMFRGSEIAHRLCPYRYGLSNREVRINVILKERRLQVFLVILLVFVDSRLAESMNEF